MVTVRISPAAKAAIEAYCRVEGVSLAAAFEAIGRRVQELQSETAADTSLRDFVDGTTRIAREIDAERRARAPKKKP